MNTGYLIYQAERTMTCAEQQRVDATHAELAASLARLWRALAAPLRSRPGAGGGTGRGHCGRHRTVAELPGHAAPVQPVTGAPPASIRLAGGAVVAKRSPRTPGLAATMDHRCCLDGNDGPSVLFGSAGGGGFEGRGGDARGLSGLGDTAGAPRASLSLPPAEALARPPLPLSMNVALYPIEEAERHVH